MSYKKHSGEFKCSVVSHYLETGNGYILTARHFGINRTQVRDWVRLFKSQGYEGLLQRQPSIHRTLAFKRLVVETLINESLFLPEASARLMIFLYQPFDNKSVYMNVDCLMVLRKPGSEKPSEEMVGELQCMRAEVAFQKS